MTTPPAPHPAGAGKRLHVLFLLSDDQQWNAIAALGNAHIKTPNLDRIVNRGMTFTQTYCMGSWGGAVCHPSRAMLMSGRTLWRVDGNLTDEVIWPQVLEQRGYATFVTGKWHNGKASLARSFTSGGHIMFGVSEGVSGFRVPSRVEISLQYMFACLLICFVLYVSYFDVQRLWNDYDVQRLWGGIKNLFS